MDTPVIDRGTKPDMAGRAMANAIRARTMEQSPDHRAAVLGEAPRVGVEAALRQGRDGPLLRTTDGFVGMTGYGASAPVPELYRHFGITAAAVAEAARALRRGTR